MVDQAFRTIFVWLTALLALFAGIFGLIETFLRRLLSQAGLSANVQSVVIIVVAVLFILAVLRAFGGVFRVLLIVFLLLLVIHVMLPNLG